MSPEAKTEVWRPSATQKACMARAEMLASIRQFFKKKQVLEVETPLLCRSAIQDPHLHPISAAYQPFGQKKRHRYYLQTSPEFAMKRLLCAGMGSMYQICKAFRNGEQGRIHNPEFTMLEWYQLGYDHFDLMNEMDEFLAEVLQFPKASRISYLDLFLTELDLNPFKASLTELKNCAITHNIKIEEDIHAAFNTEDWLDILLSRLIEPKLGFKAPLMVYHFPAAQAALSKIHHETYSVAERFEVYIHGMEIANGYHELTDPVEQYQRFKKDASLRRRLKHPKIPLDRPLIHALEEGLPDCAGVALGIDRLLMIKLNVNDIQEVIAFPLTRA